MHHVTLETLPGNHMMPNELGRAECDGTARVAGNLREIATHQARSFCRIALVGRSTAEDHARCRVATGQNQSAPVRATFLAIGYRAISAREKAHYGRNASAGACGLDLAWPVVRARRERCPVANRAK
jgi:hypothetical protein